MAFVVGSNALGASASTTKPITIKQAAKQYLADVGPYNSALDKFSVAFTKWGKANGTAAQTTTFVKPMVAAVKTLDHKFLTQRWPTKAVGAVQTLISDTAALEGDIAGLPTVNILSESQWSTTFVRDDTVMAAAADIVRKDLGLTLVKG